MRGYGQFCPIAVACEVFAQRWTPLILRELFNGSRGFNEIHRGLTLMSRTLLAERLRQLEAAGVIKSMPGPSRNPQYALTAAGCEFKPLIEGWASGASAGRCGCSARISMPACSCGTCAVEWPSTSFPTVAWSFTSGS
jgi:DNA-binding HxlR family transcriptional regulator